jgi:hypothetical protein
MKNEMKKIRALFAALCKAKPGSNSAETSTRRDAARTKLFWLLTFMGFLPRGDNNGWIGEVIVGGIMGHTRTVCYRLLYFVGPHG